MSFILDALKKSEEHRQQKKQTVAGKQVLHLGHRKHSRWHLWVIVLLLPVFLLIGWWLGQKPQPVAEVPPASIAQPANASAMQTATASTAADSAAPAATAMTPNQSAPAKTRLREPLKVAAAPIPAHVGTSRREPPRTVATEQPEAPQVVGTSAPRQTRALPDYTDLSRELRERMPQLDISLHFYSENPGRRIVRINNRLFHEGEEIDTGLAIHEITPAATILDYQGLLFELTGPGR